MNSGIAFLVVLAFYSIPEVYWILVLLWAVLDFGITLEWGPNLAYCLEVTLFLYANPSLHLDNWFPLFYKKVIHEDVLLLKAMCPLVEI